MNIESFEHACKQLGHDPGQIRPDLSSVPEKHRNALMATFEMQIICEASWEGKETDWNNYKERKWTPWFDMRDGEDNPSGFQFNDSNYDNTNTNSTGSSQHLQSFSLWRRPCPLAKKVSTTWSIGTAKCGKMIL